MAGNGPRTVYDDVPASETRLVADVQKGLEKASLTGQNLPPLDTPSAIPSNSEMLTRGTDTVRRALTASDIDPKEFEPSFLETMGAYFRSENTVGSALSSKSLAETLFPTPDSRPLDSETIIANVKRDNLSPYLAHFEGVENEAEYAARRSDLEREIEDKQLMVASTGFNSTVGMLASGIIDLPTLLPGSIGVKLGAKGVSVARAAGGTVSAAAVDAGVTELALHGTQVMRTGEESVLSIGGSIILGGMLGSGLHLAARQQLGDNVLEGIQSRLRDTVADIAEASPAMRSAGAAAVSAYERMKAQGVDSLKSISSLGANESLKALGSIPGMIGRNARIPMLDLDNSPSPSALAARASLVFTPFITKGEAAGKVVSGQTVQGIVRDFRDQLVDVADAGDQAYKANRAAFKDFADFDGQVARALVQPDAPAHPAVASTAKHQRKLYNNILDKLVEAKVLPEEVRTKYGDNYVPMMFDGDAIRARKDEFKGMFEEAFARQLREEAEVALREQATRRASNEKTKEEVVGVTAKRQIEGDLLGRAVLSPKTGKPKFETVVLSEGEQLERQRITKEQHRLEVGRVTEDRDAAFDVFDKQTSEAVSGVNKVYNEYARTLANEASDQLERITRDGQPTVKDNARIESTKRELDAFDKSVSGQVDTVARVYTDALASLEAEARELRNRIIRGDRTDAEKAALVKKVDRETSTRADTIRRERDAETQQLQAAIERQRRAIAEAMEVDSPAVSDQVRRIRQVNAEQRKIMAASEAERRTSLDRIRSQRRDEKKKLAKTYEDQLLDAKKVRDDNLVDAKKKAQARLKAEIKPVRDGLEDPLQYTRNGAVDEAKVRDSAKGLAAHWYDTTTGWGKLTLEHEIDGYTNSLKKRRTPVPHIDLMNSGFVKTQSISMLEDYARMAGTDAAVATVFKKKVKDAKSEDGDLIEVGDLRLGSVKEDIRADYEALRDNYLDSPDYKTREEKLFKKYEKMGTGKSDAEIEKLRAEYETELGKIRGDVERKLADQMERDIENVEAILDGVRGTSSSGFTSAGGRQLAENIGHINHIRLMGSTVISSLTDPVKIAIATGFANTVRGAMMSYGQGFTPLWKRSSTADKNLSKAGAAAAEMVMQSRLASMADLANPHREAGSSSVNFMRKASSVFSTHLARITFWNAFWKQTADNATSFHLGQMAHRGYANLSKSEKAQLANLRIDADGLDLIRKAHKAQRGDKFFDDMPMLKHDQWDDVEAARLVRHALGEELNNQVVTPQAYDRMQFATTPVGRVLWQFRQHMVSNQMRFIGRNVQLATLDKERTAGLALGFAGLVTAGALIDFMKQGISQVGLTGNVDRSRSPVERQLDEWKYTPGLALYNALDRSDTLPGIVMEGSNILSKTVGSPLKAAFTAFDDKQKLKEASRFKNRSAIEAVGGPTLGLANDLFINAPAAFSKYVTGKPVSRGDYKSVERLIPGQSLPFIQTLGNTLEREIGDSYSWPNPK